MLAFKPHKSDCYQVAFSPDGSLLATTGKGMAIRVSDSQTGELRWAVTPKGTDYGFGVAFSPDGSKVATVGWQHSVTLDAATSELLHQWPGTGYAMSFTPDGRAVVTLTGPPSRDVVWTEVYTGRSGRWRGLDAYTYVNRLRFSPDGEALAVLGDWSLALVSAAGVGRILRHTVSLLEAGIGALAFRPGGRTLAFSEGPKLVVFDLDAKERVTERQRSKKHIQDGAFTPDGKHFVTVSNDETAVLWETDGWTEVREVAWSIGKLKTVAVSPDGTRAACGSDLGRVVVWDLDT